MTILLLMLGLFIGLWGPRWINNVRIKNWRRRLNLNQHEAIFQKVVQPVDGFKLSKEARLHHDAMEYVYGEIEFASFIALIEMTNPPSSTRFYDLGSGTGKAVLASALVFEWEAYCGIELFEAIHQSALTQQHQLSQMAGYENRARKIQFHNANFLEADFSQASLIFINATALWGPTWDALNQRLEETASKATVITTSKKLISPVFTVYRTTRVMMSWGVVIAYIQIPTSVESSE